MNRPVIGILGNAMVVSDTLPIQGSALSNIEAVSHVSGGVPVLLPADPDLVSVEEALASCDGFVLPGGRPNVHPSHYGHAETEAHGAFDHGRDGLALPLIRACVERGQPIFGICRGFQEVAVAFGSTLHPEIRDLPDRDNHRMPPNGTLEEKFALRHEVTFTEDGPFAALLGKTQVMTNTLHGQRILEAGPRVMIDGYAPDGTPEAIWIRDAPGFTLSVQWHPEWRAGEDPVSRPLFEAFGQACAAWAKR